MEYGVADDSFRCHYICYCSCSLWNRMAEPCIPSYLTIKRNLDALWRSTCSESKIQKFPRTTIPFFMFEIKNRRNTARAVFRGQSFVGAIAFWTHTRQPPKLFPDHWLFGFWTSCTASVSSFAYFSTKAWSCSAPDCSCSFLSDTNNPCWTKATENASEDASSLVKIRFSACLFLVRNRTFYIIIDLPLYLDIWETESSPDQTRAETFRPRLSPWPTLLTALLAAPLPQTRPR